jgi:hypothetical protein
METQIGFSMAFAVVMQLAEALDVSPISRPGVWECQVDDKWKIFVNGHPVELSCSDADLKPIPGYHVLVTYNGKVASLIDPDEGLFVNYNGCTEEAFVAAVEQRIESERMNANPPEWLLSYKANDDRPFESTSPVIVGDGEAMFSELEGTL